MPVSRTRKPRVAKNTRANPDRGEHEISLGGVDYVLRPSFAACSAVEEKLGTSLIEIYRAANKMELSYNELGICLTEFIRAGAEDDMTRQVHPDRIAELIFEEGVAPAQVRLCLLLGDAISGGRDTEGNPKALATPITGAKTTTGS